MLSEFLSPVRARLLETYTGNGSTRLGGRIQAHDEITGMPELKAPGIALIGVCEGRGSSLERSQDLAPDSVREALYALFPGSWSFQFYDLGNLYAGERIEDTYSALIEVCGELLRARIVPVVIGGSQDLTYALYRSFESLEQTVNLCSIDSRLDLGHFEGGLTEINYLSHIVLTKPYRLFNFVNLGYQTYFSAQEELELVERMHFDVQRLGILRGDIELAEPLLRDTDLVSFDFSCIRAADAPGSVQGSPNGFSAEEACALARYAGISDKVSAAGFFGYDPSADARGMGSALFAQMLWYFAEGFDARKGDYPYSSKKDYQRFTVLVNEGEHELVFFRSPLSDRWWVEVPLAPEGSGRSARHALLPCTYGDYQAACSNEIPQRWWMAYRKAL